MYFYSCLRYRYQIRGFQHNRPSLRSTTTAAEAGGCGRAFCLMDRYGVNQYSLTAAAALALKFHSNQPQAEDHERRCQTTEQNYVRWTRAALRHSIVYFRGVRSSESVIRTEIRHTSSLVLLMIHS